MAPLATPTFSRARLRNAFLVLSLTANALLLLTAVVARGGGGGCSSASIAVDMLAAAAGPTPAAGEPALQNATGEAGRDGWDPWLLIAIPTFPRPEPQLLQVADGTISKSI